MTMNRSIKQIWGITVLGGMFLFIASNCSAQPVIIDPSLNHNNSSIVYVGATGTGEENYGLWLVDVDGRNSRNILQMRSIAGPRFSPDGSKIIFLSRRDVWLINADGSNSQRLTNTNNHEEAPDFTPDGGSIVFIRRNRNSSGGELLRMNLATREQTRVLNEQLGVRELAVAQGGQYIVLCSCRVSNGRLVSQSGFPDLFSVSADGGVAVALRSVQSFKSGNDAVIEVPHITAARSIQRYVVRVRRQNPPREPGDWMRFVIENDYLINNTAEPRSISSFPGRSNFFPTDTHSTFNISSDGSKIVAAAATGSSAARAFDLWLYDVATARWRRLGEQ